MIKNNKGKFIISSLIILLPILIFFIVDAFFAELTNGMIGGVSVVSLILLVIHAVCLLLTDKLDNVEGQNKKILNMIFFIIPVISLYSSSIMLSLLLGADFRMTWAIVPLLSFAFIVVGNYMPKARQSRTFGIKVKWTLLNEENWNATHRFAGKLWVIAGILMLPLAFLPDIVFLIAFSPIILVCVVSSVVYSYAYYKRQLADGSVQKESFSYSKNEKTATVVACVSVSIILVIVALLMFTGKLNFTFDEDSLLVDGALGGKVDIKYSDVESIEYREGSVGGIRVMGFASAKLLCGNFRNDEFGNYTRFTYTEGNGTIILIVKGEIIVLAADTTENTKEIYERLLSETGK